MCSSVVSDVGSGVSCGFVRDAFHGTCEATKPTYKLSESHRADPKP